MDSKRQVRSDWYVLVTINRNLEVTVGDSVNPFLHGALGVDLNQDHIATACIDPSGNPVKDAMRDIPLDLYDLSSEQSKARMGEAVKAVVQEAVDRRVPIVIEKELDFTRKLAQLAERMGPKAKRHAKRLSAFAYALFRRMLISRAARFGVRLVEVDPAYTSHVGRCWCMRPLGISVHRAAAVMIARRGMGLSEEVRIPGEVLLADGERVTLAPPARMGQRSGEDRARHVRRHWGAHFLRLKGALKARSATKGQSRKGKAGSAAQSAGAAKRLAAEAARRKQEDLEERMFFEALMSARGTAGESPTPSPLAALGTD